MLQGHRFPIVTLLLHGDRVLSIASDGTIIRWNLKVCFGCLRWIIVTKAPESKQGTIATHECGSRSSNDFCWHPEAKMLCESHHVAEPKVSYHKLGVLGFYDIPFALCKELVPEGSGEQD